jgi:lipopolysaccharide export system permease protein
MKTLHAYLIRQVIASLLLTVAVFTFVLLLGNVLKEILTLLVNRQASLGLVVEAVGLLIPFVWAFALPMGMLTATLLIFGRLSADQELTAVRASGISLLSLISPILLLSIFLCAVSALVNLQIAPRCRVAYKNLLFTLRADLSSAQLPEGRTIKDFPGYIFYIGKNRRGTLSDVMVWKLKNETNVESIVRAPRGQIEVDAPNKQIFLRLFDSKILNFSEGKTYPAVMDWTLQMDMKSQQKQGKSSITDMTFSELLDEMAELEKTTALPRALGGMTAQELQQMRKSLEKERQDMVSPLRVQIHREVSFSFACFGFTLLGIPLGIRMHRRETNFGVAIALVLVGVYYCFIILGQSLDRRPELAPHLIVWIPNFIFQAIGSVLLWRANRGV